MLYCSQVDVARFTRAALSFAARDLGGALHVHAPQPGRRAVEELAQDAGARVQRRRDQARPTQGLKLRLNLNAQWKSSRKTLARAFSADEIRRAPSCCTLPRDSLQEPSS